MMSQPSRESAAGQENAVLSGRFRVLVTGGGTSAPIDEVRQITNSSSGGFSARISAALLHHGAEVWHLHAPGALRPFEAEGRVRLDAVDLDEELDRLAAWSRRWAAARDFLHLVPLALGTVADYASTLEALLRSQSFDAILLAMAVSDYEPTPAPGKIESSSYELVIRCHRTPKVIQSVRPLAPSALIVGFKLLVNASAEQLVAAGRKACHTNQTDLTVANDLRTLRAGSHTIHVVDRLGETHVYGPAGWPAEELARLILEKLPRRRAPTP